tara:strand:- start:106219 stop:106794 length:576 start_codon:yes stop_codon:yes gene_type:complete
MNTAQEQLQLIDRMIKQSQQKISDNGQFYLLWGWIALAASLMHYALLNFSDFNMPWIVWPILMGGGGIAAWIMGSKSRKQAERTLYSDKVLPYLWGGSSISMFILLVLGNKIGWTNVYPILLCIWAVGLFSSGALIRFKPLIYAAVLNWILAIFAFFVAFDIQLLLIACSMLFSYLVPGYMLQAQARRDAA